MNSSIKAKTVRTSAHCSREMGQLDKFPDKVDNKPKKNGSPGSCSICEGEATGIHYGVLACDGCKSFFRRSVRTSSVYVCSGNKKCSISKDLRTVCRYCRLRRCFQSGMKIEAIQGPRDKMVYKATKKEVSSLSVNGLAEVDIDTRDFCGYNFGPCPVSPRDKHKANASILSGALRLYAMYLMEWASRISNFQSLSIEDKIRISGFYMIEAKFDINTVMCENLKAASITVTEEMNNKVLLHRTNVVNIFVFEMAYRSMHADGMILLYDQCAIPVTDNNGDGEGREFDICDLARMMVKELVNPMVDYHMDEKEFACLKAVLFFDPNVEGLSRDVAKIRIWRQHICSNLMDYIAGPDDGNRGYRCADIWLLLLPLRQVSSMLTDILLGGGVMIDSLLEEILNGGTI